MLSVFKGFLFVVFIICDGMSGVLQNSLRTSISILNSARFFATTRDSLKNVRDIEFKNQTLDNAFCEQWDRLGLNKEINKLSFMNCQFLEEGFYIFSNLSVRHLTLNNCGILPDDIEDIFLINPYVIESIDLSYNKLGSNKELFYDNLKKYIFNICNPKFFLKKNNFNQNDQDKMRRLKEDYYSGVEFNF